MLILNGCSKFGNKQASYLTKHLSEFRWLFLTAFGLAMELPEKGRQLYTIFDETWKQPLYNILNKS